MNGMRSYRSVDEPPGVWLNNMIKLVEVSEDAQCGICSARIKTTCNVQGLGFAYSSSNSGNDHYTAKFCSGRDVSVVGGHSCWVRWMLSERGDRG